MNPHIPPSRDQVGSREYRCPVCGEAIRASLRWHFREFMCGGCDTYLRWECDQRNPGRWAPVVLDG